MAIVGDAAVTVRSVVGHQALVLRHPSRVLGVPAKIELGELGLLNGSERIATAVAELADPVVEAGVVIRLVVVVVVVADAMGVGDA